MECLGFVLIYFMLGSLPWQGLKAQNKKEKYEGIRDKKMDTTIEELCATLPIEFA